MIDRLPKNHQPEQEVIVGIEYTEEYRRLGLPELQQAYPGDAGFDLYVTDSALIPAGGRVPVSAGIMLEMPNSLWAEVKHRSSWGSRGLQMAASVIDSGYRGEVLLVLWNTTNEAMTIKRGTKVAQLIFHSKPEVTLYRVVMIDKETERGAAGFGSSG